MFVRQALANSMAYSAGKSRFAKLVFNGFYATASGLFSRSIRHLPVTVHVSGSVSRAQAVPGFSDIDLVLVHPGSPPIDFRMLCAISNSLRRHRRLFPMLTTPQILTAEEFVYAGENFLCFSLQDLYKLRRER